MKRNIDDELILVIAKAEHSYAQIAEAVGLTEAEVARIARGELRPDLQPRINAAAAEYLNAARRLGWRGARPAVGTLLRLTDEKAEGVNAETRRKAAADLLKYAFSDMAKADRPPGGENPFPGLSAEEYADIAAKRGGPND